jgi:hypothetical protein
MKRFLLTEEEKNRILGLYEQQATNYSWSTGNVTPPKGTISNIQYSKDEDIKTTYGIQTVPCGQSGQPPCHQWSNSDSHNLNMFLSIATAFIPLIGPFVSAGISLYDANKYYKEGDTYMAGMTGLFGLLPGSVALVSKIPGIKTLGQNGLKQLAAKLSIAKKTKTIPSLNKVEAEVLEGLSKNQDEISNMVKTTANKVVSNPSLNSPIKNSLTSIGKFGLDLTKQGVGYGTAGLAYDQTYNYLQKETPKALTSTEGMDWKKVKEAFGSSGSLADNTKLQTAWKEGWRPGSVVPEKYQTDVYKRNYQEETENINKLNVLLAAKLNN